jgi:hypothetical protein
MKTKQNIFSAALVMLTLAGGVQSSFGQTLYWDPAEDNSGDGTGNWGGTNLWRSGSLLGVQTSWIQGSDATLDAAGSPGTIELIGAQINPYPASVGTLTVQDDGFVILSNNAARSLAATGVVLNGDLTLQKGSGNFSLAYSVGSGGISGTGDLTLNKSGTFSNNLTVNVAGDVSADTIITSTGAGLAGLSATSNISLTGDVTNNSSARTLLGAGTGSTLSIKTGADVSGSQTLQINNGTTGIVKLDGGTIASGVPIDVTGGTFLVATSLASTNLTVQSGATMTLGASDVLANATVLTLNGGTFNAGGFTDTLGSLTLTANSVIDFSGAAGSLTFASIDVSTWGGNTLSIWNWSQNTDHLFATSVTGFVADTGHFNGAGTGLRTPRITFYSDNGITSFGAYDQGGWSPTPGFFAGTNFQANEIVPVPEPNAVLSLGLLLLVVGWKERRHFTRARAVSQLGRLANA